MDEGFVVVTVEPEAFRRIPATAMPHSPTVMKVVRRHVHDRTFPVAQQRGQLSGECGLTHPIDPVNGHPYAPRRGERRHQVSDMVEQLPPYDAHAVPPSLDRVAAVRPGYQQIEMSEH